MDYGRSNESVNERIDAALDHHGNRGELVFSGSKSNEGLDPSLNPHALDSMSASNLTTQGGTRSNRFHELLSKVEANIA